MLSVGNHTKSLAFLLITKLRQHRMIFGHPWIKNYRVLLDMIYDSITFSLEFCMHLETFLSSIPSKPIKKTKEVFEVK